MENRLSRRFNPLAVAIAAALSTPSAIAAEQSLAFNIPPQALGGALNAYAEAAQVQLSYPAELANGLKSPGVSGLYTQQQALQKLLVGTGIVTRVTANGTVTLEKAPHTALQSDDPAILPLVKVTGEAAYQANDPYNTDYHRPNAATATRTDTPIMDTPVSIQVVPQQVLKDQQAISLSDGLKNVSGVQVSPSTVYENFVIRGFDTNGSSYRNGIREDQWAVETANVERLEVLKGPAAILYGRLEPGGIVNRVLKAPSATPYYSLQQQFGSFDNYRTTGDATGALTKDGKLTYRFNLAYQSNNSYRDLVNRDRVFIAPQFNWKISDRTEIGIGMEYQRDDFRWDDGFPVRDGANRPLLLPINTSLTDKISKEQQEREVADLHWSHEFNDDWKLSQQFSTFQATQSQFHIFPAGLTANSATVDRALWNAQYDRNTYSFNTNLVGHFTTGEVKHTLLFGHDYFAFDAKALTRYGDNYDVNPNNIARIDLSNPNNSLLNASQITTYRPRYTLAEQEWNGVYFQDQMVVWEKLHILGGGRYDWANYGVGQARTSFADAQPILNSSQVSAEKFNPRVGVVYRPWDWLSVYGNYTESLGSPNNYSGLNADGTPLKPMAATQYEAGIKTELFGGRLTSTLAFFNITRTNIATPDVSSAANLANGYMVTIGEARSQGIEFDLSGKITENLSLIANYALTDARISKDSANTNGYISTQGNILPNAALHTANLWTKYEFTQDILKGFSLGSGVRIVGQRQGDVQNDFQLPGYATWDALAAYKIKTGAGYQLTAQFNAYNLLDKDYFYGANVYDGGGRLYGSVPGAPRSFIGSLRLEY